MPRDPTLFPKDDFAGASVAAPPARGTPPDEAGALAGALRLLDHRWARQGTDAAARDAQAGALYADPVMRRQFPSPSLRAAAVMMLGTHAEAALLDYVAAAGASPAPYRPTVWGAADPFTPSVPFDPDVIAVTTPFTDGTVQITVNRIHRADAPAKLTSVLAHELMHHPPAGAPVRKAAAGLYEETAAHAMERIVYLEQLLDRPRLARSRTRLTQIQNREFLAFLNSGEGTELRLLAPRGADFDVIPPSRLHARDYVHYIRMAFAFRPIRGRGSPYLDDLLRAVAGPSAPAGRPFAPHTIGLLARGLRDDFTPAELAEGARALLLRPATPAELADPSG
jgi:hypothetical protein